jgi:hypothetical protein
MLSKKLAALLMAFGLVGVLLIVLARGTLSLRPLDTPTSAGSIIDPPRQTDINGSEAPNISSIASPSPTCSRPKPGSGACYIQWNYLYVTAASSSYIISMTVSINNQIRAYHSGFFQTAMYIPSDMTGEGYRVTCGYPQGNAGLGNTYAYAIRSRETGGLSAANYGSVSCPADVVTLFLPTIQKH